MRKKVLSFIITAIIVLFNVLIIFYPRDVIEAARQATSLWLNNVLPSLLPFFIGTNLLMGLGFVNFMGVLLEPVMRAAFNIPGCGGFALAVGMTSGYPVGAKVCASLRESGELTKTEAERLLGFSNNSGPLFMIGSVGIGMFLSSTAGYFILITNFLAAIITGCLLKYYKFERKSNTIPQRKNILKHAIKEMESVRKADGRPFGKLLADSVAKSVESILHIAGFIILFCVIIKVGETTGLIGLVTDFLIRNDIIKEQALADGLVYGLLEVTNGANKLSQAGISRQSLTICASLISFGGLSIFAQSLAFITTTDINTLFYFFTKLLNAAFTAIICWFTYPLFNFSISPDSAPAFAVSPVNQFMVSTLIYGVVLLSIIITAIAINVASHIQNNGRKKYR